MSIFKKISEKISNKSLEILGKIAGEDIKNDPLFTDPNYIENLAKEYVPEDTRFDPVYDGNEDIYDHLIEYKFHGDFDYTSEEFFVKYYEDRQFREDIQKSLFVVYTGGFLNKTEAIIIPRDRAAEYKNYKKYTLYTKITSYAKDPVLEPYGKYDIAQDYLNSVCDNAAKIVEKPLFGDTLQNF